MVADSGYGSEENYRFTSENGMEAYVKYNYFHMKQRPRFKPDPFKVENLYYNEEHDFCICPMGQWTQRIGTRHVKTASGYASEKKKAHRVLRHTFMMIVNVSSLFSDYEVSLGFVHY